MAADLDPAVQADLHIMQAEDFIKQKNYCAAQEAMGEILALQKEHDLTIRPEFHFMYAEVLDAAGLYEAAVAAVTHYLEVAARGGAHYREALSLLHTASLSAKAAAEAVRQPFRDCDYCPWLVVVPAGVYLMGPPPEPFEWGTSSDELPQHQVTICEPFSVGVYEVTFEEWDACVRAGGCGDASFELWGRGRQPAINVSWEDAQRFVAWLRRETGHAYRLLSEAEWEYIARAGTTTPFHTGSTISTSQANYNGNYVYDVVTDRKGAYRGQTVEVGSFPPNSFGLYDVHGNVQELVEDCWNASYQGAPSDGSAWESGDCSRRVVRGGSWDDEPTDLRSASRDWYYTGDRYVFAGFRVARTLTP